MGIGGGFCVGIPNPDALLQSGGLETPRMVHPGDAGCCLPAHSPPLYDSELLSTPIPPWLELWYLP